jgi:hypothetical protein
LDLLQPGGRLVAIMGETFAPGNKRLDAFWKSVEGSEYTVQANVIVDGKKVYKKYGTGYSNRLIVIDKKPAPEGHEQVTGMVDNIPDLIDLLEGVRNVTDDRSPTPDPSGGNEQQRTGEESGGPDGDGRGTDAGEPERVSEPDDLGRAGDGSKRDGGSDTADGKPGRPQKDRADTDGQRKPDDVDGRSGAAGSRGTTSDADGRNSLELKDAEESVVEDAGGGFAKYRPTRVRVKGAKEHPMLLVESSAMATVNPPRPDYDLKLPAKMVTDGLISEAQLEQVIYAGAAHSEMLPAMEADGPQRRKGYYIGDGTGVGKTREIAGIIADNWAEGRKKHILISKDKKLLKGARRDFDNIGMKSVPINDLGAVKASGAVPGDQNGVLFATYSTIGKNATGENKSRLEQIVDWVGKDFDGTITFDEAHLAGNALPVKGKRGTSKPSKAALAVVDLQRMLPNARVVYASATAATEVHNLAYADRLGLWGPGTPFPTPESFATQIDKGGIAAMEVVARDMKQMGVYMARGLSYEGVEYDKVEHQLTDEQRQMYDAAAQSWQNILSNVNEVIENHTEGGGRQRGAAMAQFWSAHQRFFNQVLTAMQMPTVLKNIESDMKAGMSPVIQIVNTNEAATKKAMAKMEEGDTLDDIDITPREDIMQYLENSFPVHQFEEYEDDNGVTRTRPAKDKDGNFIINAQAVKIRESLIDKMGAMTLPGNPLDMIIEKFGSDRVAEVTGRSQRIVTKDGKKKTERRSQSKALAEAHEFQAGKRDLLIFSDAGGTGMDFHADKDVKNDKRRSHYILQAGWRADRAIQGFGRTHRTNQKQPPIYKLAGTNLSGHKRFTSSIARRLDQLGALTKGQKDSGGGMFDASDNLENEFADIALLSLFRDIYSGNVDGFNAQDLSREMGLNLVGESGFNVSKVPPVPQFLNRLLNVSIDKQNQLFDIFIDHMNVAIEHAVQDGNYTAGVEEIQHDGAVLNETKEAFRDDATGATSQYQMVTVTKKVTPVKFNDLDEAYASITYKKHSDSGVVYGFRPASSRTDDKGNVIPTYHRHSVTDRSIVDAMDYRFKYEKVEDADAKKAWDQQYKDAPESRDETLHLVTGALLPIWDRLPSSSPKIVRLKLDDGRSLLGREIPDIELTRTMQNLGVEGPQFDLTPEEIQSAVMNGRTILLSSGHRIERRRVGGENRIEVIPSPASSWQDLQAGGPLARLGIQIERIQYKPRAFVATGDLGVKPLTEFMRGKSIVNVTSNKEQRTTRGPLAPFREVMGESRVYKTMRAELDKLGLNDVDIQFDPYFEHQAMVNLGTIWEKTVITVGNTIRPRWSVGHEAIHIYKHMGVFRRDEWGVLEREAAKSWMRRYDIDARYPDLTHAEKIEEAVAEAFGEAYDTRSDPFKMSGPVKQAFKRLVNFFKAIRNWSKGMGFQTADDIIHAIARGDFKKRKAIAGWSSQTERLMRHQRRPSSLQRTNGAFHLPDRYIWDSLINTNGGILARLRAAKGALGDRTDSVREKLQDRFLPVRRAQELIQREMDVSVPEELDVYLAEEMYSGRAGHKLDKIDDDFITPIIRTIGETKGMTVETVGTFLYARHAVERNERMAQINPEFPDGGSGMSSDEARSILRHIEESPEADAYGRIADLIDQLREQTINERVEMGLMTEFEANAWRTTYQSYVPLKGWAETDSSDAILDVTGVGRGYNVRGPETKMAMGRMTEAYNPLIGALTQAQEVVIRAEKNRVGQHMFQLAKDVPAPSLWEVKRAETVRVFNESTGIVEERSMSPVSLMMAPNEMAVKVDGKEHRILFNDPRLARSMVRVGDDNMLQGIMWLSKFSRYFSAINTMLNPVFVFKNFVRDTVTANINIQSREMAGKIQRGMMKDLPKAMLGAYRGLGGKSDTEWSKYFEEFSAAGGKVSFWVMENPESSKEKIEKRLRREANGKAGMALALVTPSIELNPVLSGIERINLAVDNAIRLAAFVHARKNGYSTQEAASVSKNLTVNFNRRGRFGSLINAAYTFSNAGFQGTHIMFKAMKTRKVQVAVAGLVAMGYLLDQANTYLSDEDDDGQLYYDKMREYLHGNHALVMLGSGADTADTALSLWLPYGYNIFPLFGNLVSRVQRGQVDAETAIGTMFQGTMEAFSPISERTLVGTISPTIMDPWLQVYSNQNWLGWDIHPNPAFDNNAYGDDTRPKFRRVKDATQLSRVVSEKLNMWTGGSFVESGWADVFPDDIDHIAGYLGGGMARTFGQSVDVFQTLAAGDEVDTAQIPLIKDLYRKIGDGETSSLYFDRRNEVSNAYKDALELKEAGQPIPPEMMWKAKLYTTMKQAEKFRRGTKSVQQDPKRAYMLLNTAYVKAWKANTRYSSESIFD